MKFLYFVLSLCMMCMFMGTLTNAAAIPTVPSAPATPPVGNGNGNGGGPYDGPPTKKPSDTEYTAPVMTVTPNYGA